MRRSASVRLGLLLAASSLLLACDREKPKERRCVDDDGRFVDEELCAARPAGAAGPSGPEGSPSEATGAWDAADGRSTPSRGGYHFIWIPYGMYGGAGTYAPGYVRGGPGGGQPGAASPGAVSRGGFGATGAAHAAPGHASPAAHGAAAS